MPWREKTEEVYDIQYKISLASAKSNCIASPSSQFIDELKIVSLTIFCYKFALTWRAKVKTDQNVTARLPQKNWHGK